MGYIHIYTGNGKGKTTCAVGLAIRALGAGLRVAFVQFDKGYDGENEHYNERHILRKLDNIEVIPFGLERMMPDGKFRFQNTDEDLAEARRGLDTLLGLIAAGQHDLIIADELVTCTGTGLLTQQDVLGVVAAFRVANHGELVLTGRSAWQELMDAADLVTDMSLVKHYWYEHKAPARSGIDF